MKFNIVATVAFATFSAAAPAADSSRDSGWDVIIVGAGPAGIIMADRMSEAGKKTLLLEQGGPSYGITGGTEKPSWLNGTPLSRVDVPGLFTSIFDGQSPMLCSGNTVKAFQACTIGGNSAINAGLFFQPPKSDFDNYFPHDWKSSDVQSAIDKLNGRQPSAPVTTSLQRGYDEAKKWLVKGAGFKETNINKDANDKSKVFGHTIFDYIGGQRGGPVVTYLQTALKRSNFKMQSGTNVLRIARKGGKATGVVVNRGGDTSTIKLSPNGRVIVSGGALQSPALLMKSGIGDPSTLSQLQSAGQLNAYSTKDWINNTAVGDGLFDNPNTFIELQSKKVHAYTYSYNDPIPKDAQMYLQNRKGPYSFGSVTTAFWDTIKHPHGHMATCQGTIGVGGYSDYTNKHTITLNIYGTSGMLSSGKVLMDNNAIPGPSDSVYYSNPADAETIATFIKSIFKGLKSSSFETLNLPSDSTHEEIVNYITKPSAYARGMVNHWSSSCRFGDCVDVDTVVKGTDNINVVDASIIPPLSVNPQMGVMIAAERAAERILAL